MKSPCFCFLHSNAREPRGTELTSWAGIKGSGHFRIQLSGLRQGLQLMQLGGQCITGRTFRACVKHSVKAGWQMWDTVEVQDGRAGVQLAQRGRAISGYGQHPHNVGIARARSPTCHHNHQITNTEEATELS